MMKEDARADTNNSKGETCEYGVRGDYTCNDCMMFCRPLGHGTDGSSVASIFLGSLAQIATSCLG